jgi:hypothetical protein
MLADSSIGLDRPSTPRDRLLVTAKVELRHARVSHPDISHRIAQTEAQGLNNVSLCFFGATYKNLTQSNSEMGAGEISIQLQRVLTFDDALCRALGPYVDILRVSPMAHSLASLRIARKPDDRGVYSRLKCAPASIATTTACASAISGISGVGAKPSSAGARTAWASTGRPVDW